MTQTFTILAEGIPPGLIFVGVFVLMVVFSLFSKKPQQTPRVPLEAAEEQRRAMAAEARRRYLAEQHALRGGGGAMPPELPTMPHQQQQQQRQSKKSRKRQAAAQAAAIAQQQQVARPAAQAAARVAEAPVAAVIERTVAPSNETARNVRLMLRRGAAREAVILGEVLAKPLALRDEA